MLRRISFTLLVLVTIVGLTSLYLFQQSKPVTSVDGNFPKLKNDVVVKYDDYGVPHIFGESEEDVHFALGYLMARDRLWQMEILRRAGSGTLSEVFGEKTVKIDQLMRKLQIRRSQENYFQRNKYAINPQALVLANRFVEGLNHFIAEENLSVEFRILNFTPGPWTIPDILSIGGVITLSFAEGIIADSLMASLLEDFDRELLEELVIKMKNDRVFKNFKSQKSGIAIKETLSQLNSFTDMARPLGLFKGSNSWVLSGQKTLSGKPILSNDPHIGFSNPGFWYEAHLKTPSFEIYGHYLPGVPFAGLGHNDKIAWAITMSEIDDIDLYLEKVDLKNPNNIIYKEDSVSLTTYNEVIKVKGADDVRIQTAIGPHGPIISDSKYDLKKNRQYLPSIKWSFLRPDNHLFNTLYAFSRMDTVKDLPKAISHATAPGFNISAVDSEGNIGWHIMGAIPVRPDGVSGAFPLEGWHGNHDYVRYLNPMENPHLYNPEKGYIVSANYYPEVDFGVNHEGFYQPSERYERLSQIFSSNTKWTSQSIQSVFLDDKFFGAGEIIKKIFKNFTPQSDDEHLVVDTLNNWDERCSTDSIGCSYFMYLTRKINKLALIDQLGKERYVSFTKVADYWHFFKNLINDPDSKWWDDSSTPNKKETKNHVIKLAINEMIIDFKDRFGINKVAWGSLHQITFEHLLGKVKPFNLIFNRGPFPIDGGYSVVNNLASARADEEFKVVHGPSTRRIIDFADPRNSYGILPLGNSGNIFDRHFDSQLPLYLKGKFRPQKMYGIKDVPTNVSLLFRAKK